MSTPLAVEARGLRRVYGNGPDAVHALRDVDLTITAGEFVAVMGPSGSGKSTLLHLVGGLDRPDAGEVLIGGEALAELNDEALAHVRRRRIGFVLQFFNLFPLLSARENVAFPLLLDGRDDALALADAALDRVGLSDRTTHRPGELSGGEQQRVAVARALVTRPAVILADEPTGSLDSLAGEDVLALLRAAADDGHAVLLITHHAPAAAYADRVVRLRDGAVVPSTDNVASVTG
ncbi:MAG: putative transport system ATP-binding protein [Actinomycetota bacterium]|jgi:putative ABC transport system ATP-binding protein|nr:putative transport system ATP-binding protein [Actinomycetota bacterium]